MPVPERQPGLTRIAASLLALCACDVSAAAPAFPGDQDQASLLAFQRARQAVIEQVRPAVVSVFGDNRQTGGGSGVLISPDGLALTNYHVVDAAGGRGWAGLHGDALHRWRTVGVDPGGDLALIQLDAAAPLPFAPLGDSTKLRLGQWVLSMGNPFNLADDMSPSVSLGIVSGLLRYQPGQPGTNLLVYGDCIQVDSSINPGNSGGPLFDLGGRVVGINGRASFAERGRVNVGLGYAIPGAQALRFLPDLMATRIARHATLGATFRDAADGSVICDAIERSSAIHHAGLDLGDRLVRVAGVDIISANRFASLITTFPADWPVEVVWQRGERRHIAWVRLATQPYPQADPPPRRGAGSHPPATDGQAPVEPGAIRDADLNRRMALRLLDEVRQHDARALPADLAAMLADIDDRTTLRLEGGDAVERRPAYRLFIGDGRGDATRLWLSVADDDGALRCRYLLHLPATREVPVVLLAAVRPVPPIHPAPAVDVADMHVPALAIDIAQARTVKIFGAAIGMEVGYASGVIVSPDGHILTAAGVYTAEGRPRVVLADGAMHRASIARRDDALQCVLLKIDAATPEHFDLSQAAAVRPGEPVLAVANAFQVAQGAEPLSVMHGIVSLRGRLDLRKRMLDVDYDAPILLIDAITSNPGAPGGAVVDRHGRLVGMIGRIIESQSAGTRLNYAVPADALARFLAGEADSTPPDDLTLSAPHADAGPRADDADLGIRLFTLAGRAAPAYIDQVRSDSPAHRAGLARDDLILAVDGLTVRNLRQAQEALANLRPGRGATLTIKRGSSVLAVRIAADAQATAPTLVDSPEAAAPLPPWLVRIETFGGLLPSPQAAGPAGPPGAGRSRILGIADPGQGPTTGVVIDEQGHIITSSFNFIRAPAVITAVLADGSQHVARLLGQDHTRKLCVLKIDPPRGDRPAPPTLVPRAQTHVGQWVMAMGLGYGHSEPALTTGIISALDRMGGRAVQTDARISPANYGGPLLDACGRLIGICTPLVPDSTDLAAGAQWYDSGIGFAVPLAEGDAWLSELMAGRDIHPGCLGITARVGAEDDDANADRSVTISEVAEDSPAARAGLAAGDAILAVEGRTVRDLADLRRWLARRVAGQSVTLSLQRGEQRFEISVELAGPETVVRQQTDSAK